MIDSMNFKHVFWVPQGTYYKSEGFGNDYLDEGWYFWDEAGLLGGGPYKTEEYASEKLDEYAKSLNKGA